MHESYDQVIVIPAGVPRKPGMTRDDLFNVNAGEREKSLPHIHDLCSCFEFFLSQDISLSASLYYGLILIV
jgi:malate/lactate dehydrogenase